MLAIELSGPEKANSGRSALSYRNSVDGLSYIRCEAKNVSVTMRIGIAIKAVTRSRVRTKKKSIPTVKAKNNSGNTNVGLFHDRFRIMAALAVPNV